MKFSHRISTLFLTLPLCLASAVSYAQDPVEPVPQPVEAPPQVASWDQTFTAETVRPHDTRSVLVVPSGEGEAYRAAVQASQALLKVIQAQPTTKLAMDASGLGQTEGSSDEAILAKVKPLPVDTVVLMRAFATDTPGQHTLVINWFDKATGTLRYAQSVRQGEPLPAPAAQSQVGVSAATQEAIGEQQQEAKLNIDEAVKAYESSYVWFEEWTGVNAQTGQVLANWAVPYKGKFKEPLEHEEFYLAVDRPELAEEYTSSLYLKRGFQITGWTALLGGGAYMLYSVISNIGEDCDIEDADGISSTDPACEEQQSEEVKDGLILGGAVSVGGAILATIGGFINPHPVDAPEARRLAAEYNEKRRKELGLPASKESRPFRMDLDFQSSKDGANVQMKMKF